MSELVQLSYNARKHSFRPASASKAPVTAHCTNCMHCRSDNMKTLANAHKRSQTLVQRSYETTSANQALITVNPLNPTKSQFRQLP